VSREAFEGGEFDWFAVDAAGHVGHFSTAGYGPVPRPVLDRLDAAQADPLWSLGERLLELPVIGTATGHLPGPSGRDAGSSVRRTGVGAAGGALPMRVAQTPNQALHLTRPAVSLSGTS
jgi:hypothetical protein